MFPNRVRTNTDSTNLALMSYGQTAIMSKWNLFYKDHILTKIGSKIAETELKINKRKKRLPCCIGRQSYKRSSIL